MSLFSKLIALSLIGLSFNSYAEQNWQNNRLTALKKITVGPWDNFEASVSRDDQQLYFTRDRNQVPSIYQQNLISTNTQQLIGQQGDAKQPALSPNQKQLAFIFYGHDAQGDVCIQREDETTMHCLIDKHSAADSPFWISDNELGYLRREGTEEVQTLMSYQLDSAEQNAIFSGAISAPSATADGRYLIFNLGSNSGDVRLSAYDRQRQQLIQPPRIDLPGISGSHALSIDNQYLYFGHYLNDTNGDQTIDGNDHSVLFRLPLKTWLASQEALLPEQLTAVDHNCKFPALSQQYLYVTCAFEGSLDIYRLPQSGAVPPHWSAQQLHEAHLAARSHAERLLLLNSERYRLKNNDNVMLERLLSNHLEIGELTAAQYYLRQLADRYQSERPKLAMLYDVLGQLLQVRASKQRVPVGIVTARFNRLVIQAREKLNQMDVDGYLNSYINSYLDYELGHHAAALNRLKTVDFKQSMLPLERYLIFTLLSTLLEQEPRQLADYFALMYTSPELNEEAHIYYAFNFLKLQQTLEPNRKKRAKQLEQLRQQTLPAEVGALFESEQAILSLLDAPTKKEQNKAYKRLSKQLKEYRKNHLLRKAQHIRAITQLGEAEHFQFMELLSRHWLLTTHISEMEFVNTAEQYSIITMDKAYGLLAGGDKLKAYNTFYSAIRQTNDLEAHYYFLTLGLNPALNKQDNLKLAYEQFEKQNLIGDHRYYVAALRHVIEAQKKPKQAEKLWQQALDELALVKFGGLNPAMRDLLAGYVYHQQLLRSQDGYDYDQKAFQKAHYHYMIALDLGRDNIRITASIYENLAWLHFDTAQYAYSADLFSQRLKLGFPSDDARMNTLWAAARASFYANQYQTAWQQSEQALKLALKTGTTNLLPFIEKAAFYAQQAEQYPAAILHYQQLFKESASLSGHNRAKALMSYAYALVKDNQLDLARVKLNELLVLTNQLAPESANDFRLLPLQAQRQQLLAHGLLTNIAMTAAEKITHLQQRINLFVLLKGDTEKLGYSEIERTAFLSKDYLRLALNYEATGQKQAMSVATNNALNTAIQWRVEFDDAAGPVIYHTLINVLSLAIIHADTFASSPLIGLPEQIQQSLSAFNQIPLRSPTIVKQQAKLELLWLSYQSRVLGQSEEPLEEKLKQIIKKKDVAELQRTDIEAYDMLNDMMAGLIKI